MFSVLVLALATQGGSALLSPANKKIVTDSLYDINVSIMKIYTIQYTLEHFNGEDEYEVLSYQGSSKADLRFHAVKDDRNFLVKVIAETSSSFKDCSEMQKIYSIDWIKRNFFNNQISYKEINTIVDRTEIYSCYLIYEKPESDLSKPDLFSRKNLSDKIENSRKLFRFFGKAIRIFAELNFKGRILHGDIRPDNIMVNYGSDGELEPKIVNFDSILKHEGNGDITDKQLRYWSYYRAPEINEVALIDGQFNAYRWMNDYDKYKYSKEFVEDVYAFGITIKKVLKFHSDSIDEKQKEIEALSDLAKLMSKDKTEITQKKFLKYFSFNSTNKSRPNMMEVLGKYLEAMTSFDFENGSGTDQALFRQMKDSFDSMKNIIIII